MIPKLRANPVIGLFLLAAVLLAACSSAPSKINVDLTTYKLAPTSNTAKAGNVTFTIKNLATDAVHEMLIVKTDLAPDKLPLLSPAKVDEDKIDIVGKMEDIPVGQGGDLTVSLPAGNYVLICNVDGHYTAGMHVPLIVAP